MAVPKQTSRFCVVRASWTQWQAPYLPGARLTVDGAPVAYCARDHGSYANPHRASEDLARRIMGARDAVVLVPRSACTGPLERGGGCHLQSPPTDALKRET